MRLAKALLLLSAFVAVFHSGFSEAAAGETYTGRLMFDDSRFDCAQRCVVTLLSMGVSPIRTALVDFGGRFMFENVPRGDYTIRIEIDGFETVNHQVRDFEAGFGMNITVPLIRKPTVSANRPGVVNVSEFLEQYPKKAVSFFEKGIESRNKKNNVEAMQHFENAVKLAPPFYQAHNQLGISYWEAGRLEDAEREFLTAHELNSKGVEPLLNLSALYLEQNAPDRAVTIAEQAVKVNSRSAPAFFNLGVALYQADQPDRAETALKRAHDLAPSMSRVRLMLANVYLKLGQYESTLQQLDTYIAENPRGEHLQEARTMRDRLTNTVEKNRP